MLRVLLFINARVSQYRLMDFISFQHFQNVSHIAFSTGSLIDKKKISVRLYSLMSHKPFSTGSLIGGG